MYTAVTSIHSQVKRARSDGKDRPLKDAIGHFRPKVVFFPFLSPSLPLPSQSRLPPKSAFDVLITCVCCLNRLDEALHIGFDRKAVTPEYHPRRPPSSLGRQSPPRRIPSGSLEEEKASASISG
ncbi:hypothetical protein NL676_004313 [Syzygium grande]|nr:hypothetical protein NL676_004313 [Syzygium grande]